MVMLRQRQVVSRTQGSATQLIKIKPSCTTSTPRHRERPTKHHWHQCTAAAAAVATAAAAAPSTATTGCCSNCCWSNAGKLQGVAAAAATVAAAAVKGWGTTVLCPQLLHGSISSRAQGPKVEPVGRTAARTAAGIAAMCGGWQQWLLQQLSGSSGETEAAVVGCGGQFKQPTAAEQPMGTMKCAQGETNNSQTCQFRSLRTELQACCCATSLSHTPPRITVNTGDPKWTLTVTRAVYMDKIRPKTPLTY